MPWQGAWTTGHEQPTAVALPTASPKASSVLLQRKEVPQAGAAQRQHVEGPVEAGRRVRVYTSDRLVTLRTDLCRTWTRIPVHLQAYSQTLQCVLWFMVYPFPFKDPSNQCIVLAGACFLAQHAQVSCIT